MPSFLTKTEYRRIQFISYLQHQTDPQLIGDLARVFGTNEDTIKADIDYINSQIDEIEITSSSLGYQILFQGSGTIQSVNSHFINHNLNSKVLLKC